MTNPSTFLTTKERSSAVDTGPLAAARSVPPVRQGAQGLKPTRTRHVA
jgi:hypothetical protein